MDVTVLEAAALAEVIRLAVPRFLDRRRASGLQCSYGQLLTRRCAHDKNIVLILRAVISLAAGCSAQIPLYVAPVNSLCGLDKESPRDRVRSLQVGEHDRCGGCREPDRLHPFTYMFTEIFLYTHTGTE